MVQELTGSPWVWLLAGYVIKWVLERARDMTDFQGNLQQIRIREDENARAEERHRVEIRALQLSNLKAELDIRSILRPIEQELRDDYGIRLEEISEGKSDRLESLKDQAIEAVAELASESEDIRLELEEPDVTDDDAV
jgi:multidrug efflux pump subunit AcrA (membrane-fusion protein)